MNRLPAEKQRQVIQLIVEGCGIRATSRITDVAKNTIIRLLVKTGVACLKFHSTTIVQVRSKKVQCDEVWSFVHSKQKNVTTDKYGVGDVWTWVALDQDTKLVISFFVGERTMEAAKFFMNDLWCRLRTRVELYADGLKHYEEAIADTFGSRVDFGQLTKKYSKNSTTKDGKTDKREKYIGAERKVISGNLNPNDITTSHLERQNLTMRMHMRRFTRKTNAFSKKIENHCYAVALYFVYYNFVRVHQTLRVTPAMEAKFSERVWTIDDILNLIPKPESKKRGCYKKEISN